MPVSPDSAAGMPNASKPTPDTVVQVIPAKDQPKTTEEKRGNGVPACIDKLISTYRSEEIKNPPRKVYSYTYMGKTVYYVPAICCDFFSDLYDNSCTLIAHPDGGITGKGDGRAADFMKARSNEKLIWEDTRKP